MLKVITTIGLIQILAIFINLFRAKIQAVLLGTEGVGVISNIDQIAQLASYLSALSLPLVAAKFLSKSHSEGTESFQKSYAFFLNSIVAASVVGTVVGVCLVVIRPGLLGSEISQYKASLLFAFLSVPSMILGGFFVNVLAAVQKSTASAMMAVVTNAVVTAMVCTGIVLNGIVGLYVANFIAGILLTVGTLIYLRKELNLPIYNRATGLLSEIRNHPGLIFFSVSIYLTTFVSSFAILVAKQSVLTHFGASEAGLLHSAMMLGMSIYLVLNPTNALFLMPMVNRNIPKAEKINAATDFLKKLIMIASLLAMPIILFPRLLLTLLFSLSFGEADQYVFLFVLANCISLLAGVFQVLIIGFDDLKTNAAISCTGFLLLALLARLLVPHYGIFGVAIGFVISSSTIFLMAFIWLALRHNFSIPPKLLWLISYNLAAMILVKILFSDYGQWDTITSLFKISLYIIYAASLLFFLSREERNLVRRLWNRVQLKANDVG